MSVVAYRINVPCVKMALVPFPHKSQEQARARSVAQQSTVMRVETSFGDECVGTYVSCKSVVGIYMCMYLDRLGYFIRARVGT